MDKCLPKPSQEAIIFEDEKLYVTLASYPIAKGHTVVVWKEDVDDLHLLQEEEYDYLMDMVESTRNALLKTLGIDKVYLIYMDEAKHVHWHLVPRYNEKGYNVFLHEPEELKDFSLAKDIRDNFTASRNILEGEKI